MTDRLCQNRQRAPLSRRQMLQQSALGFGNLALAGMLAGSLGENAHAAPPNPLADRAPPLPARAKRVIFIFMQGGPSHVDSFDRKPELDNSDGKSIDFKGVRFGTFGKMSKRRLMKSLWPWKQYGESGRWVSSLFPHIGQHVDDLCFIHSMTSKTNTHGPGENFMSTGFTLDGFPSIGAWATYALGSDNENLPAFVAIPDPRGTPQSSVNNWGPGFLPAVFQGTDFNAANPIRNLARPTTIQADQDLATRDFLKRLNERHLLRFPGDSELAARIASYELAALKL